MRVKIAVAAGAASVLVLAGPALANSPNPTGGSSDGAYTDLDFLANSHEVRGDWVRASQSGSGLGELDGYVNTHALDNWNGHKTCIQVAMDWETPYAGDQNAHYDYRAWRNCDDNYSWNFTKFTEPDDACFNIIGGYIVYFNCDIVLNKVMIARVSPYYMDPLNQTGSIPDGIVNSECRDFGTGDCANWLPQCAGTDNTPKVCTVWIRHEDGTVDKFGNTDGFHSTSSDL